MNKEERKKLEKTRKINQWLKITGGILVVGGIIAGFVWLVASQGPLQESDIISRKGMHWHPHLDIIIKGEKQIIPENIGIGITHQPIHTHDDSGTIHLEFSGIVKKDDIKLGRFFEIWKKPFNSFGSTVKMLVNDKENTELENYLMQDNDQIELRYE